MEKVYLVYVENPMTGKVTLKKVCANLKVARKWCAEYDKTTFSYIESMEVKQND